MAKSQGQGASAVKRAAPSTRPAPFAGQLAAVDSLNREIILRLMDDGRASFSEITRELGVAEGTVRLRGSESASAAIDEETAVNTVGAELSPLVRNAHNHLDCAVQQIVYGGDHSLVTGEVHSVRGAGGTGLSPLLYFDGHYHALGERFETDD